MNIARINFSHGDHEYFRKLVQTVRTVSKKTGKPIAILGDLCGPKIRIGEIENGAFELNEGDTLYFDSSCVHKTRIIGKWTVKFLCVFVQEMYRNAKEGKMK